MKKKKGCEKVLWGNKKFGTLNCGDTLGHWISGEWVLDKEQTFCRECKKSFALNGSSRKEKK